MSFPHVTKDGAEEGGWGAPPPIRVLSIDTPYIFVRIEIPD